MVSGLDMCLEDLINLNRTIKMVQNTTKFPPPLPQPRRHRGGRGPIRRFLHHRTPGKPPLYSLPHHGTWRTESVISDNREMDVEEEGEARLYLSNLHYEVNNHDIKVLFSDVGELKRYGIHYDKSGRSTGSAEVVFQRKSDGIAAMQRYDKSLLDGKRMHIELIGPESMPRMPPNVAHQQMPRLVPSPVSNLQMASARASDVTYQQMPPPMPLPVAHWQITPMPQTIPHWQRPGFIENPSYGSRKGRGFSQGQTPGESHGWSGDIGADVEKHAKWKPGSGSRGQKSQGKIKSKVSADDLDADLEKYISKRKKNTP